ncbi:type IV secretion system protein VirB10 [Roseateles sp. NT4]|uniref:type IV secretion system protein VirB10 n=1 Tax=Roseateles sp. NT4 TaxID=3453715 RepID=UPI003EEC0408
MTSAHTPSDEADVDAGLDLDGHTFAALPGEPGIPDVAAPRGISFSRKGLLAVGLLGGCLIGLSAFGIQRFAASGKKGDAETKLADKPMAAAADTRRLDMPAGPTTDAARTASPRVPALEAIGEESAEPIGVRRTGAATPGSKNPNAVAPEDAPVLLVSSHATNGLPAMHRPTGAGEPTAVPTQAAEPDDPIAATSRNLQGYQRQLQGMLDNLTKTAGLAGDAPGASTQSNAPGSWPAVGTQGALPAASALFGGQLQGSATPKVAASTLGDRSLTLPKGTAFTCALKTRVISATSGLVGCQVQRNVYSDDGRVLLIERGSHMDGEYRLTSVRPGMVRIPVLWTRIRTPHGVTVDIDSPATGKLGESGIDGHVDNRWWERIGAAMLLSLIDDSVKLAIQNQSSDRGGDTIVLPSTTANTSKLAEKVLDSTINIPPLIYQNQGGIVGIYVARDVDFSSIYELIPTVSRTNRP